MKMDWHNDKDSYLIRGKSVNKIIAMLEMLRERNPKVEELSKFISYLKNLVSYNDMLHAFIVGTRAENISRKENNQSEISLNEILSRFQLRRWRSSDGKN